MTALTRFEPRDDTLLPTTAAAAQRVNQRAIHTRQTRYLPAMTAAVLTFFLLALSSQDHAPWPFESAVLLYLHRLAQPGLDQLACQVSASVAAMILLSLLFLGVRQAWRSLAFLLLSLTGSCLLAECAKLFFHHARPQLWAVIAPQASFSFPSGHAVQSMALALSLALSFQTGKHRLAAWLIGGLYVLAIAGSRLYLGVHYPTEIAAGWALAIAWVCLLAAMAPTSFFLPHARQA